MKRFSIFALAAVAMFVGCTKDFDTDVKVDDGIVRGELVEMSLVFEDTRVERDGVSGKLSWSKGDQVAVVLSNEGTYTLDTEKYTVNHETGKVTIPSNTAYVIYPASIAKDIKNNSTLNLNIPENNTINKPQDIFNNTPMKGIVNDNTVKFYNLVGFLKVPVAGEGTLSQLTVKSEIFNGFKALTCTATLDLSDSNSVLAMATTNEGRAWVNVKFSEGLDLSSNPAIYVPVPAGSYANLALVAVTDNGATTIYANNSHTVTRSKIKPVASSPINISAHIPSNPTMLSGTSGISHNDYSNTYIVPPTAGNYEFKANLIDGTELKGGVTAEIVWAEEAGMFYDFHYNPETNFISFKTNGKKGNALVTLSKNDFTGKTIVWTWLLWCTETPDNISTISTSYTYMDRVLGATWAPKGALADQRTEKGWTENYMMNGSISSQNATDACGVYYQYQNMIPYPRIKNIDIEKQKDETITNLTNTRIAVQYGFHQYSQYWTASEACSTISVDDNKQHRTAASYNLSYMYYKAGSSASNMVWTFSSLIGGNSKVGDTNYVAVPEGEYRLWGGISASSANTPLSIKANHDPCPAGYIVDMYGALYWGVNQQSTALNTRLGFVRNPNNSADYKLGYRLYGMYFSGCTNSAGEKNAVLYYPCASNRSGFKASLKDDYGNMGFVYAYNTDAKGKAVAETITTNKGDVKVYYAAYMQYGATSNSASSLNKPAVGADKKVNAQAYNVRCLKGNTTK